MQLLIEINDDYVPEDGDAMDAVTAALNHFSVPAFVSLIPEPSTAEDEKRTKA